MMSTIQSVISRALRPVSTVVNATVTDSNGVPRHWSYDPDNDQHVTALTQLHEYLTEHDLTSRDVTGLHVRDGFIRYTPRHHGSGFKSDCELHYLVYPDFVKTFDNDNQYDDTSESLHWGISLQNATGLDPAYHSRCPFQGKSCDFCSNGGPNYTAPVGHRSTRPVSSGELTDEGRAVKEQFEAYLTGHHIPVEAVTVTVDEDARTVWFQPIRRYASDASLFDGTGTSYVKDALAHYPIRHAREEATHSDYAHRGYQLSFTTVRRLSPDEHWTCRWGGVTCDFCDSDGPNAGRSLDQLSEH